MTFISVGQPKLVKESGLGFTLGLGSGLDLGALHEMKLPSCLWVAALIWSRQGLANL
jgi:hypothetical protein